MKKYKSMSESHLGRVSVGKHSFVLNPTVAPPTNSAPFRAGVKQLKLGYDETEKMCMTDVAETTVAKWASQVVFIKKIGACSFPSITDISIHLQNEKASHFPR